MQVFKFVVVLTCKNRDGRFDKMQDKFLHFGILINPEIRGSRLTRENYAQICKKSTLGKNRIYMHAQNANDQKLIDSYSKIYEDCEGLVYRDEWCEQHLINVMQNFDLNVQFFQALNKEQYQHEIERFLQTTEFVEITDLTNYSCPGYYALVIEKYCQIYIGTSMDIKRRIRQHWMGGKMKFDRLLCGPVDKSKLSIDSFRALDTTRIFVYPTEDIYSAEDKFINLFSKEFICNRTAGGLMEFGQLSVAANLKLRELG